MKAVFTVAGDGNDLNTPNFEIGIGFNGVPGKVLLEVRRIDFQGFSGSGDSPTSEERRVTTPACRAVLESSHARAIASALLSAATESK